MTKRLAIMGTPGWVRDAARFPMKELTAIVGHNTGNLIFQYAVSRLIGGEKKYLGPSETAFDDASALQDIDYLVFPAANHLRLGANWEDLAAYLESSPVPVIVLGLGAQAEGRHDESGDAIFQLAMDESVRRLAAAIKKSAALVTVRGRFSQRVCEALGIRNTLVLGCPSLLINGAPDLGRQIEGELEAARGKARSAQFRLGVTAAAPFEIVDTPKQEVERKLFCLIAAYGGSYIQQSGGESVIAFADGRYQSVPLASALSIRDVLCPDMAFDAFMALAASGPGIYWDVRAWIAHAKSLDLMTGTRLHGNMAAIAAGTASVFLAHDARTSELVETMMLPNVSFEALDGGIGSLVEAAVFSGAAFDANRRRVAGLLAGALDELGLTASHDCLRLAD